MIPSLRTPALWPESLKYFVTKYTQVEKHRAVNRRRYVCLKGDEAIQAKGGSVEHLRISYNLSYGESKADIEHYIIATAELVNMCDVRTLLKSNC